MESENQPSILKQKLLTIEARHSKSKEEAKKRRLQASSSLFIPNRKNEISTTAPAESMDFSLRSLKLNTKRKAQIEECKRLENLIKPQECSTANDSESEQTTNTTNISSIGANFYKPLEYTIWNVESLLKPSNPPKPPALVSVKNLEKEAYSQPRMTSSTCSDYLRSFSPSSEPISDSAKNYSNWSPISPAEMKHSPSDQTLSSPKNYTLISSSSQSQNSHQDSPENYLLLSSNSPRTYPQTPSPRELVIAEEPEPYNESPTEGAAIEIKTEPESVIDLTGEDIGTSAKSNAIAVTSTPAVQITAELSADGSVVNLHISELPLIIATNDDCRTSPLNVTGSVASLEPAQENTMNHGKFQKQPQPLQQFESTTSDSILDMSQKPIQLPVEDVSTATEENIIKRKLSSVLSQSPLDKKTIKSSTNRVAHLYPTVTAPLCRPQALNYPQLKQKLSTPETCPMCKVESVSVDACESAQRKRRVCHSKPKTNPSNLDDLNRQAAAQSLMTAPMYHPYLRNVPSMVHPRQIPVSSPQVPPHHEYWYNMAPSLTAYPTDLNSNKYFYPAYYPPPPLRMPQGQYQINPYYSWYHHHPSHMLHKPFFDKYNKPLRGNETDQSESGKYDWSVPDRYHRNQMNENNVSNKKERR